MTRDSSAIITLCSHLCMEETLRPLEPKEYSTLAGLLAEAEKSPGDLFDFTSEDFKAYLHLNREETHRYRRLLDRNGDLCFELSRYRNMGIETVTVADSAYPEKLRSKLSMTCPPVFYYAGDLSLSGRPVTGYVGSRTINREDLDFTTGAVRKSLSLGYGVVSGGAEGVDTVACREALLRGGFCVEYLSGALCKRLRNRDSLGQIQQGRLLLLSLSEPDAPFRVGVAMMRNRYIYAQSEGTVVVRADLNRGGTWAGATDNLKNRWCPTLCRDHDYPGNRALIQRGAIPIREDWDGRIPPLSPVATAEYPQISLFDP